MDNRLPDLLNICSVTIITSQFLHIESTVCHSICACTCRSVWIAVFFFKYFKCQKIFTSKLKSYPVMSAKNNIH